MKLDTAHISGDFLVSWKLQIHPANPSAALCGLRLSRSLEMQAELLEIRVPRRPFHIAERERERRNENLRVEMRRQLEGTALNEGLHFHPAKIRQTKREYCSQPVRQSPQRFYFEPR